MIGCNLSRFCLMIGEQPVDHPLQAVQLLQQKLGRKMAPIEVPAERAICNQNVVDGEAIDIRQFPAQRMWPLDGGKYLGTGDAVVTKDPETGRDLMSMTLTDRLTRGTYLFDNGTFANGDDKPGVICLSYSWMSDALKMLPHPVEKRVKLALDALKKIYPKVDIAGHVIGDPITISWEADPHFLGAFKGALPGHYRYNQRMYGHFMQQNMADEHRGIFIAALHVEALRNAVKAKGGAVPNSEDLKKGMESIKGFTLGGFVPPLELTPADHEGGGWVQVWTVKGGKLVKVKDWFQGNRPTIQKHLAAEASKS